MSRSNPDIVDHGVIRLGRYTDNSIAHYDLQSATNFNAAILGQSGAGKTYTIKRLVRAYRDMGVMVVILDVHGDFQVIEGVDVNQILNTRFAYSEGDGRINPLHVQVGATGGLYIAIKQFINVVKMFNPSLGSRQSSVLRKLVQKLYRDFGFEHNDPTTWNNKAPTIHDLTGLCEDLMVELNSGISKNILSKVSADIATLQKLDKNTADVVMTERYAALGQSVVELQMSLDEGGLGGWDLKRLEDVHETIVPIRDSGLFGEDRLRLRPNVINRIALNGLHESDQVATIHLILDRLFNVAYREFEGDSPTMPRLIIVLDEGKIAKRISKSEMSPINRIATEIRKFGGGLVLGVQSSDHLTEDTRRNCGMIALLPVHPTDYANAQRMFQVSADQIKALRPKQDGLLYMHNSSMQQVRMFAP
jgi:GTPase SAR1 family protein